MPIARSMPLAALALATALTAPLAAKAPGQRGVAIGRTEIVTLPLPAGLALRSATYTPSGKVLVAYSPEGSADDRDIRLATVDDDGHNFRPFFSARIPARPKDNGLRWMVFPDNRRVFTGDFVIECREALEACDKPELLPVAFPAGYSDDALVSNRWSEIVVAPDNRHIAWTTLLANYSDVVSVGEIVRAKDFQGGDGYRIVNPRIVSTLDPYARDPRHRDGVIPLPRRGGEVKQFVRGGTALSLVGAVRRDTPDSVVQDLATGRVEAVTDTPGYTETTIWSPDERLGITMTTRFSPRTDPAILGLVPRPYAAALNMGLPMFAYTYAVTGVRRQRTGNVGPALIDLAASMSRPGYMGIDLNRDPNWVFNSPMSWHPSSRKAMWIESRRNAAGTENVDSRIRVVRLPEYRAGPTVKARPFPARIVSAPASVAAIRARATEHGTSEVKVYGRASGYLVYRRGTDGVTEKTYVRFSDDGRHVWSGSERLQANPRGQSVYTADVTLSGPRPGRMALRMTFGPLGGPRPAALNFAPDASGRPATRGFAEYGGRRIEASSMVP